MPLKFRKSSYIRKWRSLRQALTTLKFIYNVSRTTSDNMLPLEVVATSGVLSIKIHHFLLKIQSSFLSLTPACQI